MESLTPPPKRRPPIGRSHTADGSPPVIKQDVHHKRHHLHALQHPHQAYTRRRHGDKNTASTNPPQSASQLHPAHPFADLNKAPARVTEPVLKPTTANGQPNELFNRSDQFAIARSQSRLVRPVDVAHERHLREMREEQARTSLNTLTDVAHASSRRIDHIYYLVLEKLAVITSTIHSMQDLSQASSRLFDEFKDNVKGFEDDIQSQVNAFGGFEEQQSRVEHYEARIQAGMSKVQKLNDRLEVARTRVESWEQKEKAWQAKTSRRLKIGWTFVILLVVVILVPLLLRYLTSPNTRNNTTLEPLQELFNNLTHHSMDAHNTGLNMQTTCSKAAKSMQSIDDIDPRLKAFDEL